MISWLGALCVCVTQQTVLLRSQFERFVMSSSSPMPVPPAKAKISKDRQRKRRRLFAPAGIVPNNSPRGGGSGVR